MMIDPTLFTNKTTHVATAKTITELYDWRLNFDNGPAELVGYVKGVAGIPDGARIEAGLVLRIDFAAMEALMRDGDVYRLAYPTRFTMEQGTGTPLLSDEELRRDYPGSNEPEMSNREVRAFYESALADRDQRIKSLEEAAQVAVDALKNTDRRYRGQIDCYGGCHQDTFVNNLNALTKLAENGITPTKL